MCAIIYICVYMYIYVCIEREGEKKIYMKMLELPHVHGIKHKALQEYTPIIM